MPIDLDLPGAGETCRAFDDIDAQGPEPLHGIMGRDAGDDIAHVLAHRHIVHVKRPAGYTEAARMNDIVRRLAGRQQRLRGHATEV